MMQPITTLAAGSAQYQPNSADQAGGDQGADRAQQVAQHVQVGRPDVEAAAVPAAGSTAPATLTSRPPSGDRRHQARNPPRGGCANRSQASTRMNRAMTIRATPLISAARISVRW